MTTTRPLIRRAVLDKHLWRGTGYFTLTAADVRSLTATTFGQGGDSIAKFVNRYLLTMSSAAAADQLRRVRSFDPQRRQIFHEGPDYGIAPSIGDVVEVWPYDPLELVNAAISRALTRRCFSLQKDDIATNGNALYTIGTSPFDVLSTITDPDDQIFDVEQVEGSDANTARLTPWMTGGRTFYGELDNQVLAVRFDPPPTGTIRVTWAKPYADLTDETTTTTCPLEYVVWATVMELFIILEERAINHAESETQYGKAKGSYEDRYMHEHTIALGRWAFRKKRSRRPRVYRPAPMHNLRGIGSGYR